MHQFLRSQAGVFGTLIGHKDELRDALPRRNVFGPGIYGYEKITLSDPMDALANVQPPRILDTEIGA